jgi:diguanylate cyclase (GGDEF)-like protein
MVSMRASVPAVGIRRGKGWITPVLVGTLLLLTAAAMVGCWRQASLVRESAEFSAERDDSQEARYLAARELGALQGVLHEPGGEERDEAARLSPRLLVALENLRRHDDHPSLARRLTSRQRSLQEPIQRYLTLLDQGDVDAAHALLEQRIEPLAEGTREELAVAEREHAAQYAEASAQAERESTWVLVGTGGVFLLGLVVLGSLGLLSRTHRRLIERMAAQDALTGLPNRVAFQARAQNAFDGARRGDHGPTVLMLDLDGFKDVNDTLGHHIGDRLLVEMSHRLRGCVRAQDTVARLGGDEFAVLLAGTTLEIGERTAERVAHAFSTPFEIEDVSLDLEVSIGIATPATGEDLATVLRHADVAMYTAKEHRLGHTRYDHTQANDTHGRLTLLGALRRALESDEIVLHYQPKLAVDTGEVIGVEALARWNHPSRGLLGPGEFVPVLESTSLIRPFTARVLDLALGQTRTWLDSGRRIPVAVNTSTRCLLDASFPDRVAQSLLAAGVPGDLLCLEITESTIMADPERAIDVLRRIRDLGVKTSIDDFGTGYSSMAYLKILPVDEIKVDRSFVRDMATDGSNHALVESAIDLGHHLGLAVVAEGVEDDPTLRALEDLGCDVAQGFYFARPLPAEDMLAYLADRRSATTSRA